jgi:homoserine dehydrogenase
VHLSNCPDLLSDEGQKVKTTYKLNNFNDLVFQYYFYLEAEDKPGVMASITSMLASKKVGIESIVQKEDHGKNSVPIILITDPFKEHDHAELQKELLELDSVKAVRSIRIEAE